MSYKGTNAKAKPNIKTGTQTSLIQKLFAMGSFIYFPDKINVIENIAIATAATIAAVTIAPRCFRFVSLILTNLSERCGLIL